MTLGHISNTLEWDKKKKKGSKFPIGVVNPTVNIFHVNCSKLYFTYTEITLTAIALEYQSSRMAVSLWMLPKGRPQLAPLHGSVREKKLRMTKQVSQLVVSPKLCPRLNKAFSMQEWALIKKKRVLEGSVLSLFLEFFCLRCIYAQAYLLLPFSLLC